MTLTFCIDNIPAAQRAAYLAIGTRDGNVVTIDTAAPGFAALVDDARDARAPAATPTDRPLNEDDLAAGPATPQNLSGYFAALPLERLGDGVKFAIETFGLDKVARWHERVTNSKCKCEERHVRWNQIGAALKAWLAGAP